MEIITEKAAHNVWVSRSNRYKHSTYRTPEDLFTIESGDGLIYWKEAWYTPSQLKLLKDSKEYTGLYKGLLENRNDIPDNFKYDNTNSSGCNISHVYQLKLIRDYFDIDIKKINNVLEYGSGYGNLCKLFYQIGYKNNYHICELDPLNHISKKYLEFNNIDTHYLNHDLEALMQQMFTLVPEYQGKYVVSNEEKTL